jgi:hypothetical protein
MQPSHQHNRHHIMQTSPATEHRRNVEHQPKLGGVSVREEDIEPVKGIRAIALLFRGMSILLVVLMVLQVFFGLTSTVPMSVGVLFAEAVRLIIFAGLLWGAGDLAVLWVKSHHDIRATRILTARIAYMVQQIGASSGGLQPNGGSSSENEA